MSNSRFRNVLKSWQDGVTAEKNLVSVEVTLLESDLHKLKALAEIYDRAMPSITSELLHSSILEIEEAMPYVAGDQVIRVEEDIEVYEDIGPTPKYLELVESKREKSL